MHRGAGGRGAILFVFLLALLGLVTPVAGAVTDETTPTTSTTSTTSPSSGQDLPESPDDTSDSEVSSDSGGDLVAAGVFTVTPSTGLPYAPSVVVAGTGYPPGAQIFTVQCVSGSVSIIGCSTWTIEGAFIDGAGAFSLPMRLYRFIQVNGATTDCANAPGTCVVLAGFGSNLALFQAQSLAFDPSAPIPTPAMTVVPDTDLGLEQDVSVSGTGFAPDSGVYIRQCISGATELDADCVFISGTGTVDSSGNFAATTALVKRGIVVGSGQVVDCLVAPGCELIAYAPADPEREARTSLAFDPTAPLPPPPVLVATPDSGLADGQVVFVTASGFEPGSEVRLAQCLPGPQPQECAWGRDAFADASGAVAYVVRVERTIGLTDCADAPGTCILHVRTFLDVFAVNSAPLQFDPDAPPVSPPSVDVVPTSALRDGDALMVSGTGFLPGEHLQLAQCRRVPYELGGTCAVDGPSTVAVADQLGSVKATFAVRRTIVTSRYGAVDCVTDSEGCDLRWGTGERFFTDNVAVPLEFVPVPDLPPSVGGLPRTGAPSASLAVVGGGLLLVGLGLVGASRRRTRNPL